MGPSTLQNTTKTLPPALLAKEAQLEQPRLECDGGRKQPDHSGRCDTVCRFCAALHENEQSVIALGSTTGRSAPPTRCPGEELRIDAWYAQECWCLEHQSRGRGRDLSSSDGAWILPCCRLQHPVGAPRRRSVQRPTSCTIERGGVVCE